MTKRQPIQTDRAPAPIGPYSQAIRWNNLLFTSGQIPLPPTGGEISPNIDVQIDQVFANLQAVLQAAGVSFAETIKLTIFLIDLNDFAKVNQAMEKHFSPPFPARSTIQVAALPRGALLEIELMAALK